MKIAQRKSTKGKVIDVIDASPEKRPQLQSKPKKIQKICTLPVDPSKKLNVTALEHLRSLLEST